MSVRVERVVPYVAEIVMDRPEARNALSSAQAQALTAACEDVGADDQVAAVVVTDAAGRAFCTGADLKERRGFDVADFRRQRPVLVEMFARIRNLAVPSVAAVDGYALGGGCELALSCDLIVAGSHATFGLPEVGLGLIPGGGGTQLLARRVGIGRASDLILTGRHVDAEEAYRLGLIERLVPAGTARDQARALAQTIAGRSPVAVQAAQRALNVGFDLALERGLRVEGECWDEAMSSADRVEGIEAFGARREPRWPSRERR